MKAGITTSEFVLVLIFCALAVLKASVMPKLGDEPFYLISGYVGVRGVLKGISAYKTNGNGAETKPQA